MNGFCFPFLQLCYFLSILICKITQISGDYKSVRSALFQVSCKLRGNLLSNEVLNEERTSNYSSSKVPPIPGGNASKLVSPESLCSLGLSPDFYQETSVVQGVQQGLPPNKDDSSQRLKMPQV